MATQDDFIRTALRVPPDLHAQLHEAAKANSRTFNAEILSRLQASFAAHDLSGSTMSINELGEIKNKDIVQHISDLQEMIHRANCLASSLSLFAPVREERARRDISADTDSDT